MYLQFRHSHFSANIVEKPKAVQWKTTKKVRDIGHVKYEKRENKRLRGSQIVAWSCLKSSYKDDRAELFSVVAHVITKAIATTCRLDIKRLFFTRRVMQHGNRLIK